MRSFCLIKTFPVPKLDLEILCQARIVSVTKFEKNFNFWTVESWEQLSGFKRFRKDLNVTKRPYF